MIVFYVNVSLKYNKIEMSENKFDIATNLKQRVKEQPLAPKEDFWMGQGTGLSSQEYA